MSYWYSTTAWTVQVDADENDIVTFTAPILRRFAGQPRVNILSWARTKGWAL